MTVTDTIKDAAYITIGLGVIGFQKAQVRRVELTKQLEGQVKAIEAQVKSIESQVESQVGEGRKAVAGLAGQLDGLVAPVRSQIAGQLDSLEAALPPAMAGVVKQARAAALQTEESMRKTLLSA